MKYLNIGFFILSLFLFVFAFLVLPRIIKINSLQCYSQYGICSDEIFAATSGVAGKSLAAAKTFLGDQFKKNGSVEKYTFTFKIPDILRTDLILKKAKFALVNKDTKEAALLDKDGLVLQKNTKTNLPRVEVIESLPAAGETAAADKLFALNLIYSLNFYYQADFGEIGNSGLTVKLPTGAEVIFPLEGDIEVLLGSLKLILSAPNNVKLIDLRFKNPIIK